MKTLLKNAYILRDGCFVPSAALVSDHEVVALSHGDSVSNFDRCVTDTCYILPGFCDVHVHFREPGFLYKEDTRSGSAAAARGGYTAVCTMPNLNPVPDCLEHLQVQLDAIAQKACISVLPYGALTVGEKGEQAAFLEEMAPYVAGFTDDGRGVQSEDMMRRLMLTAKRSNKIIAAHCEDNSLLEGGYIHKGEYAAQHGHRGICSESEWKPIERDIALVRETGCAYHVCHISTKESVELIRKAKAEGLDVTCETAPHYLVMNDMDLQEHGRFKMNPPIRSEVDRLALVEGILDGTIDMIATDHAPHSAEEKSRGLEKSLMGVVGLETAFSVMYTHFVKTQIITMEKLIKLMCYNPRKRFGITDDIGFSVWNVDAEYIVKPEEFATMGRSTPFEGVTLYGVNQQTVYNGTVVYKK